MFARNRANHSATARLGVVAFVLAGATLAWSPHLAGAATSPSKQVAAAQAFVNRYSKAPTKLNESTPVKHKPTPGLLFVNVECSAPSNCITLGNAISVAAKAIGWKEKTIYFDAGNPATMVAAMKQALLFHPAAVTVTALPQVLWQSEIPAYKAAGVPIIPFGVGTTTGGYPLSTTVSGPSDGVASGKLLANWFIADSKGKGNALLVNIPDIGVLADIATEFKSVVANGCSGCKVQELDQSVPNMSTAGTPAIVSALQKDPTIKYVISMNPPAWANLPSLLASAGINGIKISGDNYNTTIISQVLKGQQSTAVGPSLDIQGWMVIDTAIRTLEGMQIPPADGGYPQELFSKKDLTNADVLNSIDEPANYQQQFKKLWKIK